MPDQDQILLQTKLHRPRLPHDLVIRARLMEWLNRGIDQQLTLVCALAIAKSQVGRYDTPQIEACTC